MFQTRSQGQNIHAQEGVRSEQQPGECAGGGRCTGERHSSRVSNGNLEDDANNKLC